MYKLSITSAIALLSLVCITQAAADVQIQQRAPQAGGANDGTLGLTASAPSTIIGSSPATTTSASVMSTASTNASSATATSSMIVFSGSGGGDTGGGESSTSDAEALDVAAMHWVMGTVAGGLIMYNF